MDPTYLGSLPVPNLSRPGRVGVPRRGRRSDETEGFGLLRLPGTGKVPGNVPVVTGKTVTLPRNVRTRRTERGFPVSRGTESNGRETWKRTGREKTETTPVVVQKKGRRFGGNDRRDPTVRDGKPNGRGTYGLRKRFGRRPDGPVRLNGPPFGTYGFRSPERTAP